MPWECFHLRPTTNKCTPVSGFYNWPEVVQLRKHDAAGWALLHFESFLSLSFLFHLSPFSPPFFLFFVLFAPAYSITTDATDSSLSTSLLRRDISGGWMNNQDIKVETTASRQKILIWNFYLCQIYLSYHLYNLNNIHTHTTILLWSLS